LAGRARKKMEELEKLLEIAVNNYVQLGGVVQADQKKQATMHLGGQENRNIQG